MDTQFVFRTEKEHGGSLQVFPVIKAYNWEKDEETLNDVIGSSRNAFYDVATKLYDECQRKAEKCDDNFYKNIIVPAMALANAVRGKTLVVNGDKELDNKIETFYAYTHLTIR